LLKASASSAWDILRTSAQSGRLIGAMASRDDVSEGTSVDNAENSDVIDSDDKDGKPVVWKGKNSALLTSGIIIADVVGAGILGMPRAVASFGWLLGAIVMAFMLACNVHISILMWKVRIGSPTCQDAHTYVDLCRGSFRSAPKWQRRSMAIATGISQYSFMFGLLGIYLLSAGKGFGIVFYMKQLCLPKWAAIAGAVLLPFAGTAREMGTYKSLVWVNVATLCGTVLIPLAYFAVMGVEPPEGSEVVALAPLTATKVLSGLSTFTFGMTSQFMLAEIISEMRDPKELPKAYVKLSAPFQLLAFMIAGIGGYYYLGDKASGMINENLPFNASIQIAAICLMTHMLISYLIKGVVFCRAILNLAKPKYANPDDPRKRSLAAWNGVVIPTLIAAWLLANLVPFFGDFVDLLGASFTPLSCWVIPILMFLRYYWDAEEKPSVSIFEWLLIVIEMSLASVLMILGTKSSLETLAAHWETYGYPFECHCEWIWNTCECSKDHIGMEQCLASPITTAVTALVSHTLANITTP